MAKYNPGFNKQTPIMPNPSHMMPGAPPPASDPEGTSRSVENSAVVPTDATKLRDRVLALFYPKENPVTAPGETKETKRCSTMGDTASVSEVPHWIPSYYQDSSITDVNSWTTPENAWTTGVNVWRTGVNSCTNNQNSYMKSDNSHRNDENLRINDGNPYMHGYTGMNGQYPFVHDQNQWMNGKYVSSNKYNSWSNGENLGINFENSWTNLQNSCINGEVFQVTYNDS